MKFKPRPKKWNWRQFLTADESSVIKECDVISEEIVKLRKSKTMLMRSGIVNRAIQRAKAAQ